MGYAVYEDTKNNRWAGYGVPAVCDWPECDTAIDRGMAFKCEDHGTFKLFLNGEEIDYDRYEDEPDAEEEWVEAEGCEFFLCHAHLDDRDKFDHGTLKVGKPDSVEWLKHMLTDESWADWRTENPEKVRAHQATVNAAA
ncbi:hypothetical protein [Mycetocola saprophilus]|uniref:hypothetical protein n=1 Tax=Mycetocola saprophilus TaxID=76636 RepID=UPI003BF01845